MDKRTINSDYINLFVNSVQKGFPVTFVEGSNILAVQHPEVGYVGIILADEVVVLDKEE